MATKNFEIDETLNIKELMIIVFNHKIKIALIVSIITFFTLIYTLSIPNIYKSEIIISTNNSSSSISNKMSSIASFVGINVTSPEKNTFVLMNTILNDYSFNYSLVSNHKELLKGENKNNYIYPSQFNFFKSKNKASINTIQLNYEAVNKIKNMVEIKNDKKKGLITLSVQGADRYFIKSLVDIYFIEIIKRIKINDMKELEKQILYYKKELNSTYDVLLKEELSKSLSYLYQKKVFSQANDFYMVTRVVESRIADVSEKIKPKRASLIVVSFVTSTLFTLLLIFLYEFLRNENEENN